MSAPRLDDASHRYLLDLIHEQRCELVQLRRENKAAQQFLLWAAERISRLECASTERNHA